MANPIHILGFFSSFPFPCLITSSTITTTFNIINELHYSSHYGKKRIFFLGGGRERAESMSSGGGAEQEGERDNDGA